MCVLLSMVHVQCCTGSNTTNRFMCTLSFELLNNLLFYVRSCSAVRYVASLEWFHQACRVPHHNAHNWLASA